MSARSILYAAAGASPAVSPWIAVLNGPTASGTDADYCHDVAVDSSGNCYAVGYRSDVANDGIVIVKYDANGTLLWQRMLDNSGSTSDRGYGIAVDTSGNCYITGEAWNGSAVNMIVAKYNTSGTLQWQRRMHGGYNDYGRGIAADASGNCYAIGFTYDGSFYNIVIAKYDTTGVRQWQVNVGSGGSDQWYGFGIAADASGNSYAISQIIQSGRNREFLIAKYNTSGALQWQRRLGSTDDDFGYGIAVDASGNCYVTGQSNNGINQDLIVAKYDTSGTLQWQRKFDSGSSDYGRGIAVDSSGNCYVTGFVFSGSVYELILIKYNTSGVLQWQRKLNGGYGVAIGYGVAADASGNCYVAGYSQNPTNNDFVVFKALGDGSGTGNYGPFTYAVTSFTESAASLTDGTPTTSSATSISDASASLTNYDIRNLYVIS